jgi:hypothetical protein
MSLIPIDEIIDLGDVSTYLSLKYKDEGKIFGARLDGISPKSIAIVTDALRWWNESFPNIEGQIASCTITVDGQGTADDEVNFYIDDPIYGYVLLGNYIYESLQDIYQMAASIASNLNSNPYGYTASASDNVVTVYGTLNNGAMLNNLSISLLGIPAGNDTENKLLITEFTGGVSAVDNGSRGVANYLYWMCGKFQIEAQFIIQGVGGGIVSVLDPFATPNPLEFSVDEVSIIADGESSATFTQFIGYNVLFVRNNVPQSTIDNGGSYFSWNKTTGQFSISQSAYTKELFQIYPFI